MTITPILQSSSAPILRSCLITDYYPVAIPSMREFQAMTTEARRAILILYRRIEFRPQARSQPFVHTLSDAEVEDAVGSFRHLPILVEELTHGLVPNQTQVC